MSYILDALRRADAERDRGNVPGIHAQPSFGGAVPIGSTAAPKPWLWLGSGALAVLVVGGLAWYLLAPASRGAIETVAPAPAVVAPVAVAPAAPAAPAAVIAPAPAPAPVAKAEAPPATVRRPRLPPAASSTTAEAKPAATAEKVYAINELPEDIRRQLPNLTVGGSMYSGKPADRLLILNGQVVHEGDRINGDLTLLQIRLKSALLNFKGYRYTINF